MNNFFVFTSCPIKERVLDGLCPGLPAQAEGAGSKVDLKTLIRALTATSGAW